MKYPAKWNFKYKSIQSHLNWTSITKENFDKLSLKAFCIKFQLYIPLIFVITVYTYIDFLSVKNINSLPLFTF